ncbi:MAG: ArsR/SmtB family transcription factor [Haloquadratum sp.]
MNQTQLTRLFDLLGDPTTLRILRSVREGPKSAEELEAVADASLKTVYRRLDRLQDLGLISPDARTDAEGNHYTAYVTSIEEIDLTVELDGADVEIAIHEDDSVDQFVGVWNELQR